MLIRYFQALMLKTFTWGFKKNTDPQTQFSEFLIQWDNVLNLPPLPPDCSRYSHSWEILAPVAGLRL